MKIESATMQDIPSLCSLLSQLFEQEAEFTPDHTAQQHGLKMIIANPEIGAILVARLEGQVVAMVNLLYTVSTALGGRVALLEDMIVGEGLRATGVGSQLLSEAVDFAERQGCRRITLLTDVDNHAAQRFYLRHGFRSSSMVPLRRNLSQ